MQIGHHAHPTHTHHRGPSFRSRNITLPNLTSGLIHPSRYASHFPTISSSFAPPARSKCGVCSTSHLHKRHLQHFSLAQKIFAALLTCTKDICSTSHLHKRYVQHVPKIFSARATRTEYICSTCHVHIRHFQHVPSQRPHVFSTWGPVGTLRKPSFPLQMRSTLRRDLSLLLCTRTRAAVLLGGKVRAPLQGTARTCESADMHNPRGGLNLT